MQEAASAFTLEGNPAQCTPFGKGHINDTYLLITDIERSYILQRINHRVFQDIPALMHNISLVISHLAKADPRPRHVLTLISTLSGSSYYLDEADNYWRCYDFITDSICLQQAENVEDLIQSAIAFGSFQNLLADFPAATLHETIPRFHDMPNRFRQLHEAIEQNRAGRLKDVGAEVAFSLSHEAEAGVLQEMVEKGELLLRVTHNDAKLSNVLLDAKTRKALCVIDLDTVMPGLVANDFGDAIRSGAATAKEDEKDLSLVNLSLERYTSFAKGFLRECGGRLTDREIETLPVGAKLMTLETNIRFLADFLNGDIYYHTSYPEHNLDRCRNQRKLIEDIEAHWQQMEDIIYDHQKEVFLA